MNEAQKEQATLLLREAGYSYRKVAELVGVSKSAITRFAAAQKTWKGTTPDVVVTDDIEQPREYIRDENPRTLDDLIRVCDIDTSVWEIVSFEVNKWEVGAKVEELVGEAVVSKGLISKPLFQIKVKLKPRKDRVSAVELIDRLAENIKRADRRVDQFNFQPSTAGQRLFELDLMDLHFGKYCWGEEAVTDFDLSIAAKLFREATDTLISRALAVGFERALLVIGNDVLHIDGPKGQTFAGTPMDYDGRFVKIFEKVHTLHSWVIRRLLEWAPVDVMMVQGNHDTQSAWHLGHVLATEFVKDPVAVDNAPRARKYYAYGKNLLGFTHGDKGKESELPLKMAREVPELWAKAEYREIHRGHLHKYSETQWRASESYHGITVRTLNTLTAHDKWHTDEGYMDRRGMQGFLFDKEAGLEAMLQVNVVHATGELS